MSSEEYRSVLPSERQSRAGELTVPRQLSEGERQVVTALMAVPADSFEADGDNWVCIRPGGGGRDPGWVARMGECFDASGPGAAAALIKMLTNCAVGNTKQIDAALELTLAVIQGSQKATEELAAAAAAASRGGGADPLQHLWQAQDWEGREAGTGPDQGGQDAAAKGRVAFSALSVSAHILRKAPPEYCDVHITQLLRVIGDRLQAAHQWTPARGERLSALRRRAEGAVKALSLLCERIALRERCGRQCGWLVVSLLAAPGENDFATEMSSNMQFVYEACQCLWLLTFTPDVLVSLHESCQKEAGDRRTPIIRMLNSLVRKQKRDKCVRMALLTLKNFVKHHQDNPPAGDAHNYVKEMISVGMLNTLQILQKRAFGDEDIVDDIEELHGVLETNAEDLSSYAQYKEEVTSGVLEWSPPHTSDKFWRENVKTFENDGYVPIIRLAEIINNTTLYSGGGLAGNHGALNLQIACHDMGEFVRHHPQGRKVWEVKLKDMKGPSDKSLKTRIMELIEGSGEDAKEAQSISRQALLCMQKILVRKWDHLDRP